MGVSVGAGLGEAVGVGAGLGLGAGFCVASGVDVGSGVGVGEGLGTGVGLGLGEGVGAGLGLAVGSGTGVTVGRGPASRMSSARSSSCKAAAGRWQPAVSSRTAHIKGISILFMQLLIPAPEPGKLPPAPAGETPSRGPAASSSCPQGAAAAPPRSEPHLYFAPL